jgi:iron complex outermembrane receptor protein
VGVSRALALATLITPGTALAQDSTKAPRDSARVVELPAVEIAVTRDSRGARLTSPYAISVGRRNPLGARGLPQDLLSGVPGLFVTNRNNPTQDPRIVIRGAGARTAFGVRGVRVVQDGIPLTLADGQTPLDYLDTEAVDRIEVIRGSTASLYGNSSGGVVAFTSPSLDSAVGTGALLAGSHGLLRASLRSTGGPPSLRYSASASHLLEDGFRNHSRQRATRATARARRAFGASSITAHFIGFDMPLAESPGALTSAQLATDRRMAEPLAVTRAAAKSVRHAQAGAAYERTLERGDLSATVFAGRRTLDNPLTFAVIDLDRTSGGLLLRASRSYRRFDRVTIGLDVQHQNDDRREYENCHGATSAGARCPALPARRGAVRRTQRERVSSAAPYAAAEVAVGPRYRLSGGVRADAIAFHVRDRLITASDPDESGSRTMKAVSPQVGFVALVGGASALYANVSTAFETPTATELGNKPDGSAGVNSALDPQRSRTIEAGARGRILRVSFDFAAFRTDVRDELVPFEIAGGGGRRFFRNAGRTRRRGAELALAAELGRLELRSAGSYADLEFVDFTTTMADFAGKTIPGVPAGFGDVSATWSGRAVQAGFSGRFASALFLDDANTGRAPGYGILNFRARGKVRLGRAVLSPGIALDNLLGKEYVGAVSVNAAGGRYFEPAPGRVVVASLAVSY